MAKNTSKTQDNEDILFQEINEELKKEKLANFWKKYGLLAIIMIIAGLTFAVSYESIVAWRNKRAQSWANTYAYAYNLQYQGEYDKSISVFRDMAEKNDGIYRDLARLQAANILFMQNKNADAEKELQAFINDEDSNKNLRDMAVIKLASYKLDEAPAGEINSLLDPLIAEDGKWVNSARELKAMLAIREHKLEEAKSLYEQLLGSPTLQANFKNRVQDMLTVLNDALNSK